MRRRSIEKSSQHMLQHGAAGFRARPDRMVDEVLSFFDVPDVTLSFQHA